MGLRKLTSNSTPFTDAAVPKGADREAAPRHFQPEADRPSANGHTANSHSAAADMASETLPARASVDLQTPPPTHREFTDLGNDDPVIIPTPAPFEIPSAPAPEPATAPSDSTSTDAFTAALDALRSTLRLSSTAQPPAPKPELVIEEKVAPAPIPTPAPIAAEPVSTPTESLPPTVQSESASALEQIPLPTSADEFLPINRSLYKESPLPEKRTPAPTPAPQAKREPVTMDSALQAVRDAVPGLNLTPPKSDTPVASGRKQPASDGIPKSVSEDLPKYPAKPRMRTCTRCGNETKLRDSKCQKCAYVDESLGILDAVIAGDLNRVEQVLLARPNLITLRTSRHDWTLLHMAASGGNPKMVELLIAKGASVNSANRDGKTALHYAAGKGHAGIVQILLNHLADPTVLYSGKSALDLARKNGHREVEELLREHQSPQ